jgi:hypothetical protein
MMGAFNEAMWKEEHFSHTPRFERLMIIFMRFSRTSVSMTLVLLAHHGPLIISKKKSEHNVKVRLEHMVASPTWSIVFPEYRFRHIVSSRSDNIPTPLSRTDNKPQNREPDLEDYSFQKRA